MTMKKVFLALFLISYSVFSQEDKFIEVTGSAKMYVEPDEFTFVIKIEEYWKEEFKKRKEFKDYETKVPIVEIEQNLLQHLAAIGIPRKNIKINEVGNYWRHTGKEFLVSKTLEISLNDFKVIDQINAIVDKKGIKSMRIGVLKNKRITEYRKEVKKDAIIAAKEKATYLLEAINEKLGRVISITEIATNDFSFLRIPSLENSNTIISNEEEGIEDLKKIKLRFEIKAKFAIK